MILIALTVLLASILEVVAMGKEKNIRTLLVFILLAVSTLALGYLYYSKKLDDSFASLFFRLVKFSY